MFSRFPVRRLFHTVVLMAAVSSLTFLLIQMAPGTSFDELRLDPRVSAETVAAMRASYGLDQPLVVRYFYWLRSVARGDLGISLTYNLPALDLIRPRLMRTLAVSVPALAFSWLGALVLGIAAAARPRSWFDRAISALTFSLFCLPDIIVASILLLLAIRLPSLTPQVSAVLTLTLVSLPVLITHTRTAFRDALEQPFILAARQNGINGVRLYFIHLLPAAANPLISLLGLSIAGLLSASLATEVILGWPGLGPLFLEAISSRDFPLIVASVIVSTALLSFSTLLADLLLAVTDPRVPK